VLKFEQKKCTLLDSPRCKDVSSLARLSVSLHRGLEVRRTSGNPPSTSTTTGANNNNNNNNNSRNDDEEADTPTTDVATTALEL
jgi:hypothetical protein